MAVHKGYGGAKEDLGHISGAAATPKNTRRKSFSDAACSHSRVRTPLAGHEKYKFIRDLDKGQFGFVQLALDQVTGEQVAIKFIQRAPGKSKYVQREIMNHRRLSHPHIIQLREVFLTHDYIAIAMEYAAGGNLYQLVSKSGGLAESDARWYFQQIVFAVDYCHAVGVCSRDIKLENALLASRSWPLIKLCDFGYSKDEAQNSAAASRVGTPAYLAPEIIQTACDDSYDGKKADIWSLGVLLYAMVSAQYPFGRPVDATGDSKALHEMLQRVITADYAFPEDLPFSADLQDLISRILVTDTDERATLLEIQAHPWFRVDLPDDLAETNADLVQQQQ